jgi:hypothetical protein
MDTARIELIPLDKLVIDTKYQRALSHTRVRRIVKNFNPAYLGVLSVSPDGYGRYSVYDGQHRHAALQELGVTEAWCRVVELNQQQQAVAFVALQTEHKPVTTFERHHALVVAGDPAALKIEAAAHENDLVVAPSVGPKNVRTVTALYWTLAAGGYDHLNEVLSIITKAWPENPQAFLLPVIKGTSKFLRTYPEVNRSELVKALARVTPDQAIRDAASASKAMGYEKVGAVVRYIWNLYNKKRTTNRLPERS